MRPEGAERRGAERRKRRSRGRLVRPGAEAFRARQSRSGEPAGRWRSAPEHVCPGAEDPQAGGEAPPSTCAPERRIRRPVAEGGPVRLEAARRADRTYARRATIDKILRSFKAVLAARGAGGKRI